MKRLAYFLPTVCLSFALVACPGDDPSGNTTDTDSDDDDGTSTGDPTTVTTPTVSATTPTSSETDVTMTEPTTTVEPSTGSTTDEPLCTEKDECMVADDCPIPGADCVACFCTGGKGCAEYGPGTFGDCLLPGGVAECMGSTGAACVVDNTTAPTAGVCYSTCEEPCDCPAPPAGFEAQLTCGGLVDAEGNCYITCEGGEACPDGWQCVANFFCAIGELVALPGWGDCVNEGGTCPETTSGGAGFCLQVDPPEDASTGPGGVCSAQPCEDAADCAAAPATGDAVVTCADVTGRGMNDCTLDCSGGETCPDGMVCHADFGVCYWEIPLLEPYDECVEQAGQCPDGPNGDAFDCLSNATLSFCTNQCGDATDCPAGLQGDAVPTCTDIAMGMFCVLDCAGGETCPDGMECEAMLDICVNPIGA